jgi:hypothetical protein
MRDFEPPTQLKVSVSPLYLRGDGVWEFVSQKETPELFLSGYYLLVGLQCSSWG